MFHGDYVYVKPCALGNSSLISNVNIFLFDKLWAWLKILKYWLQEMKCWTISKIYYSWLFYSIKYGRYSDILKMDQDMLKSFELYCEFVNINEKASAGNSKVFIVKQEIGHFSIWPCMPFRGF